MATGQLHLVVSDSSAGDFLREAGAHLYQREAENSLMLGLCENLAKGIEDPAFKPLMLRVTEGGRTVMAAVQTPPFNLVISRGTPAQIETLVRNVLQLSPDIPGAVGPKESVEKFVQLWTARTGKTAQLAMGQRIYQLDKVIFPKNVEGELRQGTHFDLDVLARWIGEFGAEALPNEPRTKEQWRAYAEKSVRSGYAFLWCAGDKPVSMAHVSRPTQNGITVNAVYTPKNLRGRGYASAMVAALSAKMLESYKFCVLYTDLANPTSNKIYQAVGYNEVADSKYFTFI